MLGWNRGTCGNFGQSDVGKAAGSLRCLSYSGVTRALVEIGWMANDIDQSGNLWMNVGAIDPRLSLPSTNGA
jgi:hypothetical protein